jgi:hypothetical protein
MNRSLSANACLSGGGNKRSTTEKGNYFAVNQGFVTNIAAHGGILGDKVHIYSIIVMFSCCEPTNFGLSGGGNGATSGLSWCGFRIAPIHGPRLSGVSGAVSRFS